MKKLMLLIVVLVLGITFISAQTIAEYTFATTTDGTLEDMTGSTNLLTPGSYYDDTASPVTSIGFTFAFGTGAYTQFSANSNGQMQLGATAISGGSASPATNLPRLAPLSGDNSIQTTGFLHYKVVGSAPNRKLVVEWKNLRVNYANDTTGTYCTMQAWLYEGSNNIKFVYGTMWNMSTSTQSRGVYVSTSNLAGSVGNVTDIINTMVWTNNGTGAVTTTFPASSAMPNLSSTEDGTRRVFHINYPVYTTPPNPAVLLAPANGAWAQVGSSLTWQGGGGGATSYDLYFGTDPIPAFVGNYAATSYTPTLAAGTTYYWNVVARNEHGAAAPTATWSFRTPTATQLVESFEATTFPPAGWANPGSFTRSTSYFKQGVASAYKYGSSSTQYILSTPRLTVTATSALDFWTLASSTSASLQLVYSSDRVTWTQLGSNITHAATYTWYNTIADLSSLAGGAYYFGIRTGLQAASFYIDNFIGPEITPEAPGAPVLSLPADAAINVNEYANVTWTAPVAGGIPQGYRLYLDTTNPPTTLITDQAGLSYTFTAPLVYNTTYYWAVEAYNAAGNGPQATVRSFTVRANPTISVFPWVVDFGTTTDFPPLNWTRFSGLYPTEPLTATTSGWTYDDFGNVVTAPQNMSARLNIWSTSTKNWLVTPPIAIPADGYEVRFDIAYTTYSGTTTPTAGAQADDKFIVLIADNPLMTGASVLREWNNTGSPYVYDTISNVGETHTISLNGLSGTKYIAFYGESTVSGGDNNVYVDNVTVRETPAAPIFVVSPTEWDFGQKVINTVSTKQFTISNNGGGILNINSIGIAGSYYTLINNPAPVALTGGQSAFFTVQYAPTAVGSHAGTVTINDDRAVTTINLNASCYDPTIYDFPYTQNFEAWPPFGWDLTGGSHSFTQFADGSANNWARANFWSQTSGSTDIMTTPPLRPSVNSQLKFTWSHLYSSTYPLDGLIVKVSTDGTNWTNIWQKSGTELNSADGAANTAPGTGVLETVNLDPALTNTTFWIRFHGNSGYGPDLFIDNVSIAPVPAGGPDPVTLVAPANGGTGLSMNGFNLQWTPALTGGVPEYYAVFMSMDEETIYGDLYFETNATTFNPVTEGGVSFNYEERWYWTVQAINGDGDALVEPAHWFEIEAAPQVINTFPWNEGFENAFPPTDWTLADVDGGGTAWVVNTSATYIHTGAKSAKHAYSTAVPEPGQNGWMITPAVAVPAEGSYVLSWWNYNAFPTYLVYNGVLVNTTSNPADPNWVELWSADTAASSWSNSVVNLGDYAGQTVYFAFNYRGYDADDWYVDDVSIYELTVDEIPPTITHVPHLNTPRTDVNYAIVATIVDDPTWNNAVTNAQLWYSTDAANYSMIAMTQGTGNVWSAFIPAQAIVTEITYYIEASDSENNWSNSDNFSFMVENPTWLWYDSGTPTTYLGYNTYVWGPMVLFENPYYGTGTPMTLLASDGAAYNDVTANLHVYSYDGTTMTDLITPIPVNFTAQTYHTFDLSAYNINITTPFFMISYEDMPIGNYFAFDGTRDYGTTYAVIQGQGIYVPSSPGTWMLGANITNGTAVLEAPVVTIASGAMGPELSWNAVDGAVTYKVYGSEDPYAAQPWAQVHNTTGTTYTHTGTEPFSFFQVKASTESYNRNIVNAQIRTAKLNARSLRVNQKPKGALSQRGARN